MTTHSQSSPNGETRASLALVPDERPPFPPFVVAAMRDAEYRTFQRHLVMNFVRHHLSYHEELTRQSAWDVLYAVARVTLQRPLYTTELSVLASCGREYMREREVQS